MEKNKASAPGVGQVSDGPVNFGPLTQGLEEGTLGGVIPKGGTAAIDRSTRTRPYFSCR